MSGGGAQSAVIGATGDAPEYEPYLVAIGAVQGVSDAVLGSMDWCPITNLHIANEAYEWELGMARTALDSETQTLSDALSVQFATYINALGLQDEQGNPLFLEQSADGLYHAGSYYDYIKTVIETSLNNFLHDTTFPYNPAEQKAALDQKMLATMPMMMGRGEKPNGKPDGMGQKQGAPDFAQLDNVQRNETVGGVTLAGTYNTVEDYIDALNANGAWVTYDKATNTASISSVRDFMCAVKLPSKNVGAFDDLNRTQGENTLFGYNASRPAKYWRIRTGIFQGDTALSTEVDYTLALLHYGNEVASVDFATVWGLGHVEAERTGATTPNFIAWVNECLAQ